MCVKTYLPAFFAVFVFCPPSAAQQAPGGEGGWFLISESELSSIERYILRFETERRDWLSQAQGLRERSGRLIAESASLNAQLSQQRELNRRLEKSFDGLEADRLTLVSSMGGEIAALNRELADSRLETRRHRGRSQTMSVVIVALSAGIAAYAWLRLKRSLFRFPPQLQRCINRR